MTLISCNLYYLANLYNGWANSQFTYFPMRDWFERIPCLSSRLEAYFWTRDCSRKLYVFTNVQLQFALISFALISYNMAVSQMVRNILESLEHFLRHDAIVCNSVPSTSNRPSTKMIAFIFITHFLLTRCPYHCAVLLILVQCTIWYKCMQLIIVQNYVLTSHLRRWILL